LACSKKKKNIQAIRNKNVKLIVNAKSKSIQAIRNTLIVNVEMEMEWKQCNEKEEEHKYGA
jgi:hypothetical protein